MINTNAKTAYDHASRRQRTDTFVGLKLDTTCQFCTLTDNKNRQKKLK